MNSVRKSDAAPRGIAIFGAASCVGARDQRCDFGPQHIKRDLQTRAHGGQLANAWCATLRPDPADDHNGDPYTQLAGLCTRLAQHVGNALRRHQRFAVIGGDHSCAVGTWSGAAAENRARGAIGLIWIDAHLDSHTPVTSHSGALHGMPLAHLLGHGDPRLTGIAFDGQKLAPAHLCVFGARSYEPEEAALLNRLGVRVIDARELNTIGMTTAIAEALRVARGASAGYGISIDLDAVDPVDAPGVGSPEPGGIPAQQLLDALAPVRHDPALLGIEIAEFNPFRDRNNKTAQLVIDLMSAML
jgi:arginase